MGWFVAVAGVPAWGQAENEQAPVYIADASLAEEALSTVGAMLARGGEDEAVRLIQRVLEEQGDRLIESEEPGLFIPVRERVHRTLLGDPELLGAYRARQGPRARTLLDQGAWREVERSYWLTERGSEAALRLAQVLIESAQFDAGLRELSLLERHPDAASCAGAAADLARRAAGFVDTERAWSLAARWAGFAGKAPPERRKLDRPTMSIDRPISALSWESAPSDRSVSLDGVVARALHDAELTELEPVLDQRGEPGVRAGSARARLPWAMPTIAGGTLLVSDGLTVTAFDRFTLRPRWRVRAGEGPVDANTRELRARLGRIVEDSTSVTVDGNDVFVSLGLPRSGGDRADGRLACIDLETGRIRWVVSLGDLSEELAESEPRGPVMVEGDLVVVGARKNQRSRRLVSLSVVAVDRTTGALRWSRPVGSAGSLPFQQLTHLSEGGVLRDGVVYWSDKMGLVAAVETSTGRARWVRSTSSPALYMRGTRVPFATNIPVVNANGLFVLSPDQAEILQLDPLTGAVRHRRFAEPVGGAAYLVMVGDWIASIGAQRVAFYDSARFAERIVHVTDVLDEQGIRGRAVSAGDRLAVPVAEGLALIEPGGSMRVETMELESTGNIGLDEGQVIVVEESDVFSFLAWETASEMLRVRVAAGDLGAALAMAELAHRSGHAESVLTAIDDAIGLARGDAAATERTFGVIRRLTDPSAGDRAGPVGIELRGSLLERLGRVARTGEQRVAHAMAVGDWQADRGEIARAAGAYQDILLDRPMAKAIWNGGGLSVRSELEASRRLQELAERFGSGATGMSNALANEQARVLVGQDDPAVWTDLARRFPVSDIAPEAWAQAARSWANRERWTEAERAARTGIRSFELAKRRGAVTNEASLDELAGVLVRSLNSQERADEVFSALEDLAGRLGQAFTPTFGGRAIAVGTLKRSRRASVGNLFQRNDTPELVVGSPIVSRVGSDPSVVLMHAPQGGLLSLHRVGQGQMSLVWSFEAGTPGVPTLAHAGADRAVLIYPAMPELGQVASAIALDLRDGRELWKFDLEARIETIEPTLDDPGSNRDAQIVSPIEGVVANRQLLIACDGRTLFVTDRRGRAIGIDASSGRELWAGPLGMSRVFGIDIGGGVVGVCGGSVRGTDPNDSALALRGVGEVIDPRTGETLQLLEDLGANTRWVRAAPDGQVFIASGSRIVALDTLEGRVDWSNGDDVLTDSEDAWVLGEWLVVMGQGGALWMIPRREGVRRLSPLDMIGRSADRGWTSMERVMGQVIVHGAGGLTVYDRDGSLAAADSIQTTRSNIASVIGERATAFVERSFEDGEGRTSCFVSIVETKTGILLDRVQLQIPLGVRRGPTSIAIADGHVVIGFNEVSVMLRTMGIADQPGG